MTNAYVELHAKSAFSFLEGASLPEDLVERAAALGLPAMALVDANGVYGAPRFFKAAQAVGVRPLVGAEVTLEDETTGVRSQMVATCNQTRPDPSRARVTLLIRSRKGYQNLCRLITAGAAGREKGQGRVTWAQLATHAEGLHCLTGGSEGLFANLSRATASTARRRLEQLHHLFPNRLAVELQRRRRISDEHRNAGMIHLAQELHLPLLATNGVALATPAEGTVLDVLTCLRHHCTLETAGRRLDINREAYLKGAQEMQALFADLPQAVAYSVELADQLAFTLADLGYRFPDYPLPDGETPDSFLRRITLKAAPERFRPMTAQVRAQLDKELTLIAKLKLAGYFLIVWDIVQFCHRKKIFVQGRGSAANSAVCFALSITAVDPIKMELLFERFLSEERNEWPDIDLDLPSGDQREKVIQHLYSKYGALGAAMTANVITYRPRSAMREVSKVLGYTPEEVDRLAKHLGSLDFEEMQRTPGLLAKQLAAAGFDKVDARLRHTLDLWTRFQGLPRHLGQHSGGMVIAAGRLDDVVPLEPASMPGRVVIQWDKEDCADLGLIKVDLLGLGMLQVLEEAMALIHTHEHKVVDVAQLPADDPKTYAMIAESDTVGVFQLESRAQMSSLPRHPPHRFYDIVTQVALIRPGPILGGMMRPFYERFAGREPVTYVHPVLEPILKRTLGVPLFQEQVLRIAIDAAGFTGGEAEQLRRAMGWKRSYQRMEIIEKRLRQGMAARGLDEESRSKVIQMIFGFASYGFPESHAASFALIAYASAYLKAHHSAAFYVAILNAWPMGFYHPATLVQDAMRHGVRIFPINVARSGWGCRWEEGGVRIGLRYVKGLSQRNGKRIEEEMTRAPFRDAQELALRACLHHDELERLAEAGALVCFGLTRRAALWQVSQIGRPLGPLFGTSSPDVDSPLPELSKKEVTLADYRSAQLTVGAHLMSYYREALRAQHIFSAAELLSQPVNSRVRMAGSIIVRQRPESAKGYLFITLEDETGMIQAIINRQTFLAHRAIVMGSTALIVTGTLQREANQISIRTTALEPLHAAETAASHDFR